MQVNRQVLGVKSKVGKHWATPSPAVWAIPTEIKAVLTPTLTKPSPTLTVTITPTSTTMVTPTPVPTNTPTSILMTSTPTTVPTLTPVSKTNVSWGAYTGWQSTTAKSFEILVGKPMQTVATFVHWGNENDFPVDLGNFAKSGNKKLVIFWEAMDYNFVGVNDKRFSYDAILRGDWDSYVKNFAAQVKAYSNEVILVLFEEMNGDWYPWSGTVNGNSPAKHIAAYRRIHDLFAQVPNAKFGWDVNNDDVPDKIENRISDYYPGDEYVDYIGMNGFNFGDPWQDFSDVFAYQLPKLEAMNKPIYIFSMACAQGTKKADWIKIGLGEEIYKHPKIIGWVWFNENKEKDWRVNSDQNSLAAFKGVLP